MINTLLRGKGLAEYHHSSYISSPLNFVSRIFLCEISEHFIAICFKRRHRVIELQNCLIAYQKIITMIMIVLGKWSNIELGSFCIFSHSYRCCVCDAIPYPGVTQSPLLALTRHDQTQSDMNYKVLTNDKCYHLQISPKPIIWTPKTVKILRQKIQKKCRNGSEVLPYFKNSIRPDSIRTDPWPTSSNSTHQQRMPTLRNRFAQEVITQRITFVP